MAGKEALKNLKEINRKQNNGNGDIWLESTIIEPIEKDLERLDYYEKIKLMLKQKECVLRYIESEDCFAVRCILDENWYKLSKDFVENNIKEEVKPTPLINKVKELKEKVEKQDKILERLKKPMFYSERKKLGEEFLNWAEENNASKTDLTSIVTWCFCFKMKEWLEDDK